MSGEQLYYIRVPRQSKPGGRAVMEYISVDVSVLHPGIVSELFVRDRVARDPQTRYLPVAGMERPIANAFVVTEMQESLREIREIWESSLIALGPKGQEVWDDLCRDLPFATLIESMARRNMFQANEALRSILYGLLSTTASLTEHLIAASREAEKQENVAARMGETFAHESTLTQNMLLDWGSEADCLARCVDELARIEGWAKDIRARAAAEQEVSAQLLLDDAPLLTEARNFLDGTARDAGFLMLCFRLRTGNASVRDRVVERLSAAEDHVRSCRSLEKQVQGRFSNFESQHPEIIRQQQSVGDLVARLSKAAACMRYYQARFGQGMARPHDIPGDVVTRDDFERAEQLLRDPAWSPEATRSRLLSLLMSTLSLLDHAPRLSEDMQRILAEAERNIAEFEEELTAPPAGNAARHNSDSPDQKDAEDIPVERTSCAPVPRNRSIRQPSGAKIECTPARADELYRLVIGIGGVLTCKVAPFAQSSIRAMLEVGAHLGCCTEEEVAAYLEPVTELSKRKGEREVLDGPAKLVATWKKSRCRWIQYLMKNRWRLKLASSRLQEAMTNLDEFHITPDLVRSARLARRDTREAAWQARKKSKK